MAKKTKRSREIIYVILAIFMIMILSAGIKIYEDVLATNVNTKTESPLYIYIYTDLDLNENFERIKQSGVLKNTEALARIINVLGYSDMVKPGKYQLDTEMSNLQIMRMLVSGRQHAFDITFKYAERIADVSGFWSRQLEADSTELHSILTQATFVDSLGLTQAQAICIFIPNTYNFYWNMDAHELINRMIKEYRNFWNETRMNNCAALNLTPGEVMTLASIVQKETNKYDEMPVVAGVYYNRILKGMLLQADPTILYAMNDKSIRRVSGEMLKINSDYNTYKNKGLPPGPICIPGTRVIDAVLNMQRHQFYYFCAKEDFSGYHSFATNFAAHQVNANKYQRALNKRGIK